ncbi:recQ-mediated genome instability protein 1 isoform X2 [Harpegnathos saltator]|uniref:recQ-mediated genome instability protein 1 isoform X2 n=1 Tax=Harpegnathos saltator TaxID=610380 RepID=UPI000590B029|nr:recQ-mediated genome instability protein 1 isoform X2 [Harpegnathos saltator]
MNENILRRIKGKLNARFYVMNDSWLKDCVEFFIEGKALHERTDKHILEFVESQWQLSDLREINNENGCLPKNLVQQVCTVLTGTYILQVDKMYDITSSKYKQLCHIRKVSSSNLEVTENEKPVEWEPKPRRMMQWCLTDGVQDVTAIEYTPLEQMTGTLLPGYKVMIIGPVHCRRGVILLVDGKYKEIGGEVESMLKPNALENVLARALDEPENSDPYNDSGQLRNSHHNSGQLRNQNNQNMLSNSINEESFFDDDFEQAVDLEALTAIERRSQETVKTTQNCPINSTEQRQETQTARNNITEEFLEDIDFEPLEDWPDEDSPMRPLQTLPSSRMGTEGFGKEDDLIIVEEISSSTYNLRDKPSFSAKSRKNKDITNFPDDDIDFDDCEIIETESRVICQQQSRNPYTFKSEAEAYSSRLTNTNKTNIEKYASVRSPATRNKKPVASTSRTDQKIPETTKISNSFAPPISPKICDVLSDVLRENITGTIIYRTVKAKVKNHSTLTKQDFREIPWIYSTRIFA